MRCLAKVRALSAIASRRARERAVNHVDGILHDLLAETGRADMIIGTYVSNRKRPELQNMFGDFSNLVTLRLRCELDKTLRTFFAAS